MLLAATERWRQWSGACAVAVGNFDGVHVGHARIVDRLLEAGSRRRVPTAAFTFDPHPSRLLRPDAAPVPLSTPERRAERLVGLGVDAVLVQPVDAGFLALSADDFYSKVLRGTVQAAAIVEGADFRFGAGRKGDIALLCRLAAADGVEVTVVEPVTIGGLPVSSSRVRALVAAGDMAAAATLLAAPYRLEGEVVHGAARGRALGFPTANLSGIATLVPAPGVYAGRAILADAARASWPAAVHVGTSATFGTTAPTVEVHLVGYGGDLYGRRLAVDFLARLRETRRFDSPEALRAALAADVSRAAEVAAGG